jgi:hypothetical protein
MAGNEDICCRRYARLDVVVIVERFMFCAPPDVALTRRDQTERFSRAVRVSACAPFTGPHQSDI